VMKTSRAIESGTVPSQRFLSVKHLPGTPGV
jgi:hypothetical protein